MLLTTVTTTTSTTSNAAPISGIASFMFSPLRGTSSCLMSGLSNFGKDFISSDACHSHVDRLRSRITSCRDGLISCRGLGGRIRTCRGFLRIGRGGPSFGFITKAIVNESSTSAFNSFILGYNSGSKIGIGSPMVDNRCLVNVMGRMAPASYIILSMASPGIGTTTCRVHANRVNCARAASGLTLGNLLGLAKLAGSASITMNKVIYASNINKVCPHNLVVNAIATMDGRRNGVSCCTRMGPRITPKSIRSTFIVARFRNGD